MKIKSAILCGMLACAPLFSLAGDKLYVQVPAKLDPSAPIAESVKRECGVEQLIGNHVLQQVSREFPGAKEIRDPARAGQDRVLLLSILSVHGVGGGAWSGAKSISLRAQLSQNGQVLQQRVMQRQSTGGAFGGSMGTCAIMERIAVALGKDTARWLSVAMQAVPETPSAPTDDVKMSK